ncbi:hypothetical protein B5E64_02405 [Drancourtella sp. An12]|uniref:hypothetical protein n=1 Tax=Drancourtella sp. An12 TaxID=1965548 RepID=UPI000B3659F8|nr:hypothetical protein [Drancourtella sp. An12]OUQ46891.1 hypothetical protein B5E64_02405 [Drancourtella sp. An12]
MGWRNNHQVNVSNRQLSNVFSAKGKLENVGAYLCPNSVPANFIISGGVHPDERYQPLYTFFDATIGRFPIIVLHNNDIHMEAMVTQAWQSIVSSSECSPLWIINQKNSEFEPFFGMNEMQVVLALRQLANKLNYSVTPRFERVIKAHLSILKELNIPISLSGLNYLCQFYDIGEFHENIMALSCGEAISRRIWADLGIDSEDSNSQFDLFRAVISNLAHDASHGGWNDDNCVSEFNCLQAIGQNATLLLSVNDMYSEMLLPYLAEELKAAQKPFILIIDDTKIADEHFQEYLRLTNSGCCCGIIAENAVDLISGEENNFLHLTERMNTFIILKHSTGKTATILSEIFGRYDYTKVEMSQGTNRGFFSFLPQDRHDDLRFSTENRYRVMPEEIIGLRAGQAIVFDTTTDQIIRYN